MMILHALLVLEGGAVAATTREREALGEKEEVSYACVSWGFERG